MVALASDLFPLFQMVNITLLLTSLTLCGAIFRLLGSKHSDLMRARLFIMAPKVRSGILFFLLGFSLILIWESFLGPANPPTLYAYAFDVAGDACLLLGLFRFYALVKPQVNLLGISDDEIPEVMKPGGPGNPGGV